MRLRLLRVLLVCALLVSSVLLYGCLTHPGLGPVARPVAPGPPVRDRVPPPAATVSLSAQPTTIAEGGCATLTWSATHASSLIIDGGVGHVNLRGSRRVCPEHTTQYTIATGGGSPVASATVTVTPRPAATVSLSAQPTVIAEGECATLTWSVTHVPGATIDHGIGAVNPEGSREICPVRTTQYTMAAQGGRESPEASATVSVTPRTAAAVVDRLTLHIDFDLRETGSADTVELQKAVAFAARYPGYTKAVIGHTDSIGSDEDNQGLSQRRADAVRMHLLRHGVADDTRITTVGYGESRPIADNATKEGRFRNRRVEILILRQ